MPGSAGSASTGPGSQFSLGTVLAALAGGVAAAVITTLTIAGSMTFNAATAPSGEAAKSKLWHDSTTNRLMDNVANAGSKYVTDTGGYTTNKLPKASGVGTLADSSITDDGTTVTVTGESVDVKRDGIAATSTDGLVIANNTPTVKGVNQVEQSPRLRFRSNVNDTDGGGTNDTHDFILETAGTAGATSAATLLLRSSINGAAPTTIWTISESGGIQAVSAGSANFTTSGAVQTGSPSYGGTFNHYAVDGALCQRKWIGEEITIAAGTATKESSTNLLPASSCIFGVVYRLKTDGGAIATVDIGPTGNTDAWINDGTCAAAGDTGTWAVNGGDATYVYAGARNPTAATLTVTTDVNSTGSTVIQVYVLYEVVTAPIQD